MGSHNIAYVTYGADTIAIILVHKHHCSTEQDREKTLLEAKILFPGKHAVVAWQTAVDEINYLGDNDILDFLKSMDFKRFNWNRVDLPLQ